MYQMLKCAQANLYTFRFTDLLAHTLYIKIVQYIYDSIVDPFLEFKEIDKDRYAYFQTKKMNSNFGDYSNVIVTGEENNHW